MGLRVGQTLRGGQEEKTPKWLRITKSVFFFNTALQFFFIFSYSCHLPYPLPLFKPSMHLSNNPPDPLHPSIHSHLFAAPIIYPSIYLSTHTPRHLFICQPIQSSTHQSSTYLLYSSLHSPVNPVFDPSLIYPSIYPFIYLSVHILISVYVFVE